MASCSARDLWLVTIETEHQRRWGLHRREGSLQANTHPGQGKVHFQLRDASAYAAALAKAKGDGGIWVMRLGLVKPPFRLERVGIGEVLLIT